MTVRTGRPQSLYDPRAERDACGVGFIANIHGASHEVLQLGLSALACLSHRGAVAADAQTGDGAGILAQLPQEMFGAEYARLRGQKERPDEVGVGVFFLPRAEAERAAAVKKIERALAAEGADDYVWRPVPVREEALGAQARANCPAMMHVLVARPALDDSEAFERRLFRVRRRAEHACASLTATRDDCYAASLSARTIVYKGLMMAAQLAEFYPDLADPEFRTAGVIYHQRYSTNTAPSWQRAQPFRRLAHNGEINTLQGNVNWMRARQQGLQAPFLGPLGEMAWPFIDPNSSDSGQLDNAVELLHLGGRSLPHVMMLLVPEAWEGIPDLPAARRDFYRYHACLMEPWDGPAALVFGDGRSFGAILDRNGLRPMRYAITDDGWVFAGSEVGLVDVDVRRIRKYGKLGPGQLLLADLEAGRILESDAVKEEVCGRRSYGAWLAEHLVSIREETAGGIAGGEAAADDEDAAAVPGALASGAEGRARLLRLQRAFSYTKEERVNVIRPMVEHGHEGVGSMGDDTPHAVLSHKERPFFHYFKQCFAEVTNPPIDHLREDLVFSLRVLLGPRPNLLEESPEHAHVIELPSPVLFDRELAAIRRYGEFDPTFRCAVLDTVFPCADGPGGLEPAVRRLCEAADAAVDAGAGILVLSDRAVDTDRVPMPSLMAVGAVHHHLIRTGRRMRVSIIAESGEPREIHHLAVLLGYGANAVNPYLVLADIEDLVAGGRIKKIESAQQALRGYRHAAEEGLKKVMSKMGISTVEGYTGAQIFEAIGVDEAVIECCFPGTASRFQGNGFREFGALMLGWHAAAFPEVRGEPVLAGFYRVHKDGETHEFNPAVVETMHAAIRGELIDLRREKEERFGRYRTFLAAAAAGGPSQLRHLLEFRPDRGPVPLDEVEPVTAITRRFSTGNMSLGALSPEAHETLAVAMNRLGGRSACGEGGEDPVRFGTERNSAVKQVASGRFGVTPAYLASALELQIKMAQGSKPGEGGQIPARKVTEYIARIRHTTPGVALISPPPHHDIYSIEDLAQLIYDLKQVNPKAEISVKLVSQSGVGIIAAGVAKGHADIILISGHSGGTGSSPLNSIKNAGLPWEIGLAETQQTLVANGLRGRVALRVDGGFRTGRDVVMAALLGADQFSFGTAAMVAEGCIMMRVCHTDNCPVGVATQQARLREKFTGTPAQVMNYFLLMAEEVREILAGLGYRSLDEVIGRVDLLRQERTGDPAADRLDLSPLLAASRSLYGGPVNLRHTGERNSLPPEDRLDTHILDAVRDALDRGEPAEPHIRIQNRDRTIGARLAWEIAQTHGDRGLPADTVKVTFDGTAGQSFGAFLTPGVTFHLVGLANDYVGKGMAGGEIVIRPHPDLRGPSHQHVLLGNTVLYGATGGTLFAAGRAGERFAVRNSGAVAVVEGTGDHGCEYMTGGTVVVLGRTGYNFAAGMTGGEAFVLDLDGGFQKRFNDQLVHLTPMLDQDVRRLQDLIETFVDRTGSERGHEILRDWDAWLPRFFRLAPKDEVRWISSEEEGNSD